VEIYDGGIGLGKAWIYNSQHCGDKSNHSQWIFLCFRVVQSKSGSDHIWTSIGRHGQPSASGMASMEAGSCDDSLVDCDIFAIPKVFLMFSGLPSWMETLTLRTSIGRHGQPSASGMALIEAGTCEISQSLPVEVRSVSVFIQECNPENLTISFGNVKIYYPRARYHKFKTPSTPIQAYKVAYVSQWKFVASLCLFNWADQQI